MANDGEVGKELARSKDIFLREPPGFSGGPPKLYNVVEEFPKTRANRSPVVPVVVIFFLVVFVAVAVTLTYFIDRATRSVPIGIEEFQDVNLADILDGQKQNQTALELAKRELADLSTEMADKIRAIQEGTNQRVELLANQDTTAEERDRSARALRDGEQSAIRAIRNEYAPRIDAKTKGIAASQARVDAYDSRMIAQAKKSEEALNNQQKLFESQRGQLRDYYEEKLKTLERQREIERRDLIAQKDNLVALLKKNQADEIARLTARYNPTFTETAVVTAIARGLPARGADTVQLVAYRQTLAAEGVLSQEGLAAIRGYLADFSVLLKRLQAIPYINSVPDAIRKLDDIQKTYLTAYETLWTSLVTVVDRKNADIQQRDSTIRDREATIRDREAIIRDREATIRDREATISARNATLEQLTYALDSHTRTSRENGYIMDPRDTARMFVYMNPTIPFKEGAKAYVFRREDEPVATVELHRSGDAVTARLLSLAGPGAFIAPFDKILVQLE